MRRFLLNLVCHGFTYLAVIIVVAFLFSPNAFAECGCSPGYNCSAGFCKANGGSGCPKSCPITPVKNPTKTTTIQYITSPPTQSKTLSPGDFAAFDKRLSDLERRVAALEGNQFNPLEKKPVTAAPPIVIGQPYKIVESSSTFSQGTVCVGGQCYSGSQAVGAGGFFAGRPKPLRRIVRAVFGACGN